jgi:hypothetical protein
LGLVFITYATRAPEIERERREGEKRGREGEGDEGEGEECEERRVKRS